MAKIQEEQKKNSDAVKLNERRNTASSNEDVDLEDL